MQSPLPSNEKIIELGTRVHWKIIEDAKKRFNKAIKTLNLEATSEDELPLDRLSEIVKYPVHILNDDLKSGNVIYADYEGQRFMLGSYVSKRYRKGKTLLESIVPYNLNPSVNHTNFFETDSPTNQLRAIGAELELGLHRRDGSEPDSDSVDRFIDIYRQQAHQIGITPQVDREACEYQVEVHVAPGVGYNRTRQSIDGIMRSLCIAGEATQLNTAMISVYPLLTDFTLSKDPKVQTAVDVMVDINNQFPEYVRHLTEVKAKYGMNPEANCVEVFRIQGCHIHLDVAGRSEALAMFAFYSMLHSASALANKAILKGGPFVNGTCDAERLCLREYLRSTTVTGRYIEMALSPHLIEGDMERYASLLINERANSPARAHLYDDSLGVPISVMHNPIGRIRPDLGGVKRICTVESTGLPVNVSASRQAAVLVDFEFTHALIESYYRKHGLDLEPMMNDKVLWDLVGPYSLTDYQAYQDQSDRVGSNLELTLHSGRTVSLAEFYAMKRRYFHKNLVDTAIISPRDIDDVYTSLDRMLDPPSGRIAETVEQYIYDPLCRSTGNWGQIMRNGFEEEGGVIGTQNPEAVLRVTNRIHDALVKRYL
ncbi:hypothetical protein MASR2M15_10840 [Anaerolineales bacterium]